MESCNSTFHTWLSSGVQRFQVNSSRCGPISPRSSRGEDHPSYTYMVWMSATLHPSSQVLIPQMISDAFLACQNVPKFQANTMIIIIFRLQSIDIVLTFLPPCYLPSFNSHIAKEATNVLHRKFLVKFANFGKEETRFFDMSTYVIHQDEGSFHRSNFRNFAWAKCREEENLLFGFERT